MKVYSETEKTTPNLTKSTFSQNEWTPWLISDLGIEFENAYNAKLYAEFSLPLYPIYQQSRLYLLIAKDETTLLLPPACSSAAQYSTF